MRSLILSASAGGVLLASGCMFLPDYNFDAYLKDDASSASGTSTSSGSSGGGAGASTSSGGTISRPEVRTPMLVNQIAPPNTTAFAVDEQFVYWVAQGTASQATGTLRQDSVDGGHEKQLLDKLHAVPWMIYDTPNRLYWVENTQSSSSTTTQGTVKYLDLDNPGTSTQLTALNGKIGYRVTVAGKYVYTTAFSVLAKTPIGASGMTAMDAKVVPVGPIVADGTRVYWVDKGGIISLLLTDAVSDSSNPRIHGSSTPSPNSLGVASNNIYWTAGTNVLYMSSVMAPLMTPVAIRIKDVTDVFTGLNIVGETIYISTLHSVIAIKLPNPGQTVVTPLFVVNHLSEVVAMMTNIDWLFIADRMSVQQKIRILKVKR
jgi:hypothetical protein